MSLVLRNPETTRVPFASPSDPRFAPGRRDPWTRAYSKLPPLFSPHDKSIILLVCLPILGCSPEPAAYEIPLNTSYVTFIEDSEISQSSPKRWSFDDRFPNQDLVSKTLRLESMPKVFFVNATHLESAALTSLKVINNEIDAPLNAADDSDLWIIAYLGNHFVSPPLYELKNIEVTKPVIRIVVARRHLRVKSPGGGGSYLAFVPLPSAQPGPRKLELHDSTTNRMLATSVATISTSKR